MAAPVRRRDLRDAEEHLDDAAVHDRQLRLGLYRLPPLHERIVAVDVLRGTAAHKPALARQQCLAVLCAEELDRCAVRVEHPKRTDTAVELLRMCHEIARPVPVAGHPRIGQRLGDPSDVELEHRDVGLLERGAVAPLAAGELGGALCDTGLERLVRRADCELRPHLLVDVCRDAGPLHDLARLGAQGRGAQLQPAVAPVGDPEPAVELERLAFANELRPLFDTGRPLLGVEPVEEGETVGRQTVGDRRPGHLRPSPAQIDDAPVGQRLPQDLRHGVGHDPEVLLAISERRARLVQAEPAEKQRCRQRDRDQCDEETTGVAGIDRADVRGEKRHDGEAAADDRRRQNEQPAAGNSAKNEDQRVEDCDRALIPTEGVEREHRCGERESGARRDETREAAARHCRRPFSSWHRIRLLQHRPPIPFLASQSTRISVI